MIHKSAPCCLSCLRFTLGEELRIWAWGMTYGLSFASGSSGQWSLGEGGAGCLGVWMCYLWSTTSKCLALVPPWGPSWWKDPCNNWTALLCLFPWILPSSLHGESRGDLIQEEASVGGAWIAHPVTSSWATSTPCLPILTDRSGSLASIRFLLSDFSAEAVSWKTSQALLCRFASVSYC